MTREFLSGRRLLIVANRLPFTVTATDGELRFKRSPGGLASGLSAFLNSPRGTVVSESLWVGWPGITVDNDRMKEELRSRIASDQILPVFLSEEDMNEFYEGFCNKIIWPLFHYFSSYAVYDPNYWTRYRQVNQAFHDAIVDILKPGDIVWVHDYHLMLLPRLLRASVPDVPVGFFLHIPFPSYEIFRLLPSQWRTEILNGLLGADLIGFHTHDYTQHFCRCVLRILGHEHQIGKFVVDNRVIQAATFPMGIDFHLFHEAARNLETKKARNHFRKALQDLKVILSVDRLDYTKGILNRLQGYELFLERHPEWHGKVALILVVVPSRIGVVHYRQMRRQIEESVGRINGTFGTITWTPILYQFRFFSFHPLVALYNISDVALVTPLRDGMNLVAKEYVASRRDQTGVLILSEMAGASRELGEALVINPNSVEEIADALIEALEMPPEEQVARNQIMQERLRRHDVVRWATEFIDELLSVANARDRPGTSLLSPREKERLLQDFKEARHRCLFLDYDGTLVPFARRPEGARPDATILEILARLSADPATDVVLVSGRDKDTLERWFGALGIGLIAEHGVWIKAGGAEWRLIKPLTVEWKDQIRPILENYADGLPGSLVEEKDFSLAWHYRAADPELGPVRAKELLHTLVDLTANVDVQILQGNKVIEVRSTGVNKGFAALYWLSQTDPDFVLAAGDDWTDEDLFGVLPEHAYSIKVGIAHSQARFSVSTYETVRDLLKELVQVSERYASLELE